MISSFVLSVYSLEEGENIKKYHLYEYIFSLLKENGVTKEELKNIIVSNFFTKDISIIKNKKYSFKVASLNSKLTIKILGIFFYKSLTNTSINIYDSNFFISNIYNNNNKYSLLLDIDSFLSSPLKKSITVNFLSPTFFKVGDTYKILKEPVYILKNLLTKMKKSSLIEEIDFSNDFDLKQVRVEEIKFKQVNISQYKTEGFIGTFIFHIDSDDDNFVAFINLLFYFSFFSGIGFACEKGYGQISTDISIL